MSFPLFLARHPAASFFLRYIKNLYNYLLSFVKRTQPLEDIESQQRSAAADFDKKWQVEEIPGWEDIAPKSLPNGENAGIWCSACKNQ